MDEIVREVLRIARGMWKLPMACLVAGLGRGGLGQRLGLSAFRTSYEASARIYVDTQSILKPLMAGLTVQPNVEQQINMLSRTLLSRPNLEKLVRMADMDLAAGTKAEQEALIEHLAQRDLDSQHGSRQPVHPELPRREPGQGQTGHPVDGVDLRRVESWGPPARTPIRQRLS